MTEGAVEIDFYPSENHPNGTNKVILDQKQASIQLPTASAKVQVGAKNEHSTFGGTQMATTGSHANTKPLKFFGNQETAGQGYCHQMATHFNLK